ncbi:MAG: hypothetical protein EB023_12250, partial [Flavobacteriia bacterium]|nr:hypothetical protein [Flavobacteriia bacterium]
MTYKLLDWIDITQIRWDSLSENPAAIDLLREHPEQIVWYRLCSNQNPEAIEWLRQNPERIHWS